MRHSGRMLLAQHMLRMFVALKNFSGSRVLDMKEPGCNLVKRLLSRNVMFIVIVIIVAAAATLTMLLCTTTTTLANNISNKGVTAADLQQAFQVRQSITATKLQQRQQLQPKRNSSCSSSNNNNNGKNDNSSTARVSCRLYQQLAESTDIYCHCI